VYPARWRTSYKYYGSQGADRAALWRLIRERKYGVGFVDRVIADEAR